MLLYWRTKMLTLRKLLQALNQVAIDREDLLDKPIVGDFDSDDSVYYQIGVVDVVKSFSTQEVKLEFVKN